MKIFDCITYYDEELLFDLRCHQLNNYVDYFIIEVSSFTLHYSSNFYAYIGVVLNVAVDHLSWHGSFEDYRNSKYKLYNHCKMKVCNLDEYNADLADKSFGFVFSPGFFVLRDLIPFIKASAVDIFVQ